MGEVSGVINKPNGYAQYTSLAAAKSLKTDAPATGTILPDRSIKALIQAETQDIRWTDDGTTPTAAIGMLLKANTVLEFEGNLATFKMIEVAASAKVNISYYKY